MKKIIVLLGLVVIFFSSDGQTVLLNVDRNNESVSETGQNLKKFSHLFLRFGFLASQDFEGARIKYGSSVNVAFGVRKKFKISSIYSPGFEIEGQFTDYKLKQEKGKILPDTIINSISGRMDYYSLGVGFFNRFNFDPHRGNFLGHFLDIGIMGSWDFSVREISKNKLPDGKISKSVTRNLPYTNSFEAKVYSRLCFSHIGLYGSYRLTDLFESSSNYPDLPRVILGIDIGIF